MSLDKKTVARIAHLARIKVPEEDLEPLAGELNNILGFIEQLNEVDTDGVDPLASVVEMNMRQREDAVTDGGYPDRVLANGPETAMGFYTVPKVVE
ncbi:Asp-tRNA(Asn)/Glu-tRNA(Gln) amidotransferase subunit GatC [Aestuariispira insulae]|uniref:Aspartyl/glutamyl-tRNA(Asn/Gln) amidotransferase subunit C n=1 Tax=Aestuariispira insulae TaxID=1461337 RepID=A0A3D9HN30_9PROT|nr:Asp-tRNA(Asn)/Glu-tRNA(Gln) amidotransferase subunit GatC [Aestuariispira insulae]RED50912.1 aspartyl/glutamyl-tRNA(Asn/Gln) amidotransferase subunit C [Aestuariispira insulae]